MGKRRCESFVIDKKKHKKRRCKKKAVNGKTCCAIHGSVILHIIQNKNITSKLGPQIEFTYCCFCNNPCNPASQSCGRCSRIISWY